MDALKLPRSSHWPALRQQWLRDHPTCAACGGKKNLEVHHKIPVHVARSMELDPDNLITLCEWKPLATMADVKDKPHCHLDVGHLGNWFSYNKNVEKNAHDLLMKTYPKLLHNGTMKAAIAFLPTEPKPETVIKPADPAAAADNTPEPTTITRIKRVRRQT